MKLTTIMRLRVGFVYFSGYQRPPPERGYHNRGLPKRILRDSGSDFMTNPDMSKPSKDQRNNLERINRNREKLFKTMPNQ